MLITLFEELKEYVISSPLLSQFGLNRKIFLELDWSAEGMGWILIQPVDGKEYIQATKLLTKNSSCKFDLKYMKQDFNL